MKGDESCSRLFGPIAVDPLFARGRRSHGRHLPCVFLSSGAVAHPAHVIWLREGVALFFIISGYAMVASTTQGSHTPWRFLVRRIRRIGPLYWFATACAAAGSRDWTHLVGSILFIPTIDPATAQVVSPVLNVGWTLNLEMAFYTLFALAMALPCRAAIWTVIVVLVLLSGAARVSDVGPILVFYGQPLLLDFAVGMLIASRACARLPNGVW